MVSSNLGLTYEFQHTGPVSYKPGGLFEQENIPGRFGGNTSGVGPSCPGIPGIMLIARSWLFLRNDICILRPAPGQRLQFPVLQHRPAENHLNLYKPSVLALQGLADSPVAPLLPEAGRAGRRRYDAGL